MRFIEPPILSLRAARRFFAHPKRRTTRGAQLAFGKNHIVSPQTLRGRAKTQPPRAGCPRDVRYELRSKSGYHLKNVAWGLISIPKLRLDILTAGGHRVLDVHSLDVFLDLLFYSILIEMVKFSGRDRPQLNVTPEKSRAIRRRGQTALN